MPKLSVIVPIYNGEKYLRRCLDSILAQSFLDFELILIDDGSKDNSGNICDEYAAADKRVTVIHTENRGVARARKTGLELTGGKYVTCVDCDDWIDQDLYSHMIDCAERNDADIVVCKFSFEPQTKLRCGGLAEGIYGKTELVREVYPRMIYDLRINTPAVNPSLSDKLFRRELLTESYKDLELSLTLGEDAMCTYPCLLAANCICFMEDSACYHYWQEHSENMHQMGTEFLMRIKALAKQMELRFWNKTITQLQSECYIAQYSTDCIQQIMVRNRTMSWQEKKKAILEFLEDSTIWAAFCAAERHITDQKLKLKIHLLRKKRLLAFGCLAAGKELVLSAKERMRDTMHFHK